ncbi:hypothetical protein P692DRAFT_201795263 [Suillus brevipes Sb2]|nr:hypothetical protein P692DRAFT_201795263 [Suillus brevipes Sb2]
MKYCTDNDVWLSFLSRIDHDIEQDEVLANSFTARDCMHFVMLFRRTYLTQAMTNSR